MLDFTATWKQLLADLERERDELRVKAHLGKAEARDLFAKTEKKFDALRERLASLKETEKAKGRAILTELRTTLDNLKSIL